MATASSEPSMDPTGAVMQIYDGIDQDDVGKTVRKFAGSQK